MGQPVVHWEMWSKDPDRLGRFYGTIFGWEIQDSPELNYRFVNTGGAGGINGGMMTPKDGPWPGNLALYVAVDDLAAYVARIAGAGGRIIVERAEVPGMGAYALFEDPDGRVLGIWQQQT
jgi:predicted enzyme related to lactoylglutathione lyase